MQVAEHRFDARLRSRPYRQRAPERPAVPRELGARRALCHMSLDFGPGESAAPEQQRAEFVAIHTSPPEICRRRPKGYPTLLRPNGSTARAPSVTRRNRGAPEL